MVDKLRSKGGPTAAVAQDQQVENLMATDLFSDTVDAEQVVKLAAEADRAAPSSSTANTLMTAYLFQAAKDLHRTNPAFAAFYNKYYRSTGVLYLMAVVASEQTPLQQDMLRHAGVRKAIDILKDQGKAFPDSRSAYEWACSRTATRRRRTWRPK